MKPGNGSAVSVHIHRFTAPRLSHMCLLAEEWGGDHKQGWGGLGDCGERKVGPCAYIKAVKKKSKMTLNFCPRPESLEINNEEIFVKA